MNPRLDAVVAAIRKHLPLAGAAPHQTFWFLRCWPRGRGVHVRLAEYRCNHIVFTGPYTTASFFVRTPEDVEPKLRERCLV